MYSIKTEKNLINIIRFGIIFPILFFSISISYLLINQKNVQLKTEIFELKEKFIQDNKKIVKNEVQRVVSDIKYQIDRSNQTLKLLLKDKVYEAHAIATNIYNEEMKNLNKNDKRSKEQVIRTIKNALSGMIYDQGKGYIFIDDINGIKILQPLNKSFEGKIFLEYQDAKGYQFVKKIVKTIKNKTETFDEYYWYKSEDDKIAYKKLSFYKYFEPLNAVIGTGKYIHEHEESIKKELLARINKIRFDRNGYIFTFNSKGTYLTHYNEENIGKNGLKVKDLNGKYFIKYFIDFAKKNKSGFYSYFSSTKPNDDINNAEKISYLEYLEEWDLIIGAGFYLDDLNNHIKETEASLVNEHSKMIDKILVISFIVLLLLLFVSVYISQLVSNRFLEYKKKLLKEEIKYKSFMENSSDAIFIINMDGYIYEYSKQFKNILGYSDVEISKIHISEYETILDENKISNFISKMQNKPMHFESIYKKKDGTLIDVSLNTVKVQIDEKNYIYASFRDITRSKKLQQKIVEQKVEFQTIFDYSQDGIAIIDFDLNFLKTNKAFRKITGYTKEELLSFNYDDITAIEDIEISHEAINRAIKTGHALNIEKSYFTKKGRVDINISISLLPDKKRLLLTIKDISTLKMIEKQTKLASMGEMIGNIAHQWRQPLSIITTSISGLKLKAEYFEVEKKDILVCSDDISKQANYLSDTIENFRNFLKVERDNFEVSLKEIIENSLSLVDSSLKNNFINIVLDIEEDMNIFCNKNEISEAMINLITNSKDVLINNVKKEEDRLIFINTKKMKDNKIKLTISDSGGGIDDSIMDKIFVPYFTTKHQSQGTGLGLSMVDKIIRQRYGNIINVYNKKNKHNNNSYYGACFEIIFTKNFIKRV